MDLLGFLIAAALIAVAAVLSVIYIKRSFFQTQKSWKLNESEPDDAYDWDTANWPDDFVFLHYSDGKVAPDRGRTMQLLREVNKENPKKRAINGMDNWFDTHIADLCKSVYFLEYIATYGYLTERFIKKINEQPELNTPLLQMKLCSVYYGNISETYHMLCTNLLWEYLQTNDLVDEVKETISNDVRFTRVLQLYLSAKK